MIRIAPGGEYCEEEVFPVKLAASRFVVYQYGNASKAGCDIFI